MGKRKTPRFARVVKAMAKFYQSDDGDTPAECICADLLAWLHERGR